ncbi:MAG: YceI family protein [Gammaproteobacteria bacterium]
MKSMLRKLFFLLALSSSFVLTAQAETKTYTLDPSHTHVLWHISHFGFSNPSGKWFANGTLMIDEKKLKDSKLDVTIQVADIVTGIPKLDEHLKSADFFDVAKFPTATFVSDKVVPTGKDSAKVYGTLTVRGISKPEVLMVKLNNKGLSPASNKQTMGFSASTKIKRSDFGMTSHLPGLGDEVKIDIEAEANTPS